MTQEVHNRPEPLFYRDHTSRCCVKKLTSSKILDQLILKNIYIIFQRFVTKEEKTGGIGECSARDVTINVKSGSLPLVKPDGSKIGARLLETRRRHYTVPAQSNGDENFVSIVAPPHGDWYVIAYRSWFDPDNGKISQQGEYCTSAVLE